MTLITDDWLSDLGFTPDEVAEIVADAQDRARTGQLPDVRPLPENGDTQTDIAASRRDELMRRRK